MKTMPPTKYAILGVLMSGPRHGYEIRRLLISRLGPAWHISSSQLYLLLKKLDAESHVHSKVETQENRPSKRVFLLTSAGRAAFLEWVGSPTEHVRGLRIEFLAKLFFLDWLSLEGGGVLVEGQINILKQIGAKIRKRQSTEKDPFSGLVLGFRMATVEAWIQWLIKEAGPFVKGVEQRMTNNEQPITNNQ